jgi:hypothetical protein
MNNLLKKLLVVAVIGAQLNLVATEPKPAKGTSEAETTATTQKTTAEDQTTAPAVAQKDEAGVFKNIANLITENKGTTIVGGLAFAAVVVAAVTHVVNKQQSVKGSQLNRILKKVAQFSPIAAGVLTATFAAVVANNHYGWVGAPDKATDSQSISDLTEQASKPTGADSLAAAKVLVGDTKAPVVDRLAAAKLVLGDTKATKEEKDAANKVVALLEQLPAAQKELEAAKAKAKTEEEVSRLEESFVKALADAGIEGVLTEQQFIEFLAASTSGDSAPADKAKILTGKQEAIAALQKTSAQLKEFRGAFAEVVKAQAALELAAQAAGITLN